MSSLQNKLNRMEAWLERQNALDDEISKGRPNWWHAGKIVLGLMLLGKSIALAMKAVGAGGYVLAAVGFVCGAAVVIEGANMLRNRWMSPLF